MDIKNLLEQAKNEGRKALTEAEAKQVLSLYGIPVVNESVAATVEEAIQLSAIIGFPVVLKGLGAKLTHKTDRGLVYLNLKNPDEVTAAAKAIAGAAGGDLEGYLVAPMIRGRREFVAGMFCDPQFGPVVMFGLGGIFTEALGDAVFRVAPLEEHEAESMLDELHAARLLGTLPRRGGGFAGRRLLKRWSDYPAWLWIGIPSWRWTSIRLLPVLTAISLPLTRS